LASSGKISYLSASFGGYLGLEKSSQASSQSRRISLAIQTHQKDRKRELCICLFS